MTQHHDAQLPDRHGDVIDDIAAALSRRGDLSDEHRAFYGSLLDRFEALTADRDRLRTAWESARRGRAETHATSMRWAEQFTRAEAHLKRLTGSAGRSVETLAEKSARLEAEAARLPEADLVEPGDEVPALAELADRVTAIEQRLDDESARSYSQGVEGARERAAATVARRWPRLADKRSPAEQCADVMDSIRDLSLTDTTEGTDPARYRDSGGDVWEHVGTDDTYELVQWADGTPVAPGAMSPRTLGVIQLGYGPLTPVSTEAAGGAE